MKPQFAKFCTCNNGNRDPPVGPAESRRGETAASVFRSVLFGKKTTLIPILFRHFQRIPTESPDATFIEYASPGARIHPLFVHCRNHSRPLIYPSEMLVLRKQRQQASIRQSHGRRVTQTVGFTYFTEELR